MSAPPSTLGLEQLGDLSALLQPAPPADPSAANRPLEIPLSDITEDPHQPRTEFDGDTLEELAESIRLRGVKTPISVRPHGKGEEAGYVINHGARRFRASRLAGRETIPAWVDADYTEEDQIIENIHRDALRPREIAEFVGRKLSAGKKQVDIAKALGKSKAYVSQYATLLDLPEPIAEAFNAGRTGDVTLINELVKCHAQDPGATVEWMATQEVSRGSMKGLREYIDSRAKAKKGQKRTGSRPHHPDPDQAKVSPLLRKPTVQVECGGRVGLLLFARRPTREGHAWVNVAGVEKEWRVEKIRLVSVTEG